MNFTVADALKVEPLSLGKVIAGAGGLDNVIQSVGVMEFISFDDPQINALVNGPALEISSLYSVMDSVEDQVRIMRLLRERGTAGFVLCHVGIVLKDVSQELVDVCNEIDFPLILMPTKIGYKEIIRSVSDALMDFQNQKLRNAIQIYDYITSLLIEAKDGKTLVSALEKIIGRRVLYFDCNISAVYASDMTKAQLSAVGEQIRRHAAEFLQKNVDVTVQCEELKGLIHLYPVRSSASYFGVLTVISETPLTETDSIAVLQTKNALSISTLNKINAAQQRKQVVADFISDLINGRCKDNRILLSRSAALGCNLEFVKGVILLDIFQFKKLSEKKSELEISHIKKEFVESVEKELALLSPSSICSSTSDKVIILFIDNCCKNKARQLMLHIGQSLQYSLQNSLNISVSVGLGHRCNSVEDVRSSYETAIYATQIANGLFNQPSCVDCEAYAAYILLMKTFGGREDAVRAIVDDMLGPLRAYDKETNNNLEETFRTLLSCDMDANKAADQMYLHKNTVLQRKRKISGLYGNDPFSLHNRRQFEIALILESLLLR